MKQSLMFVVVVCMFVSAHLQETSTSLTSRGTLRHYESKGDSFFIGNNYSSLTRIGDDDIAQKKYDDKQRIILETFWKKNSEKPFQIIEYTYKGDSPYILSKTIEDFLLLERIIETYNDEGFIIKRQRFLLVLNDDSEIDEKKTNTLFLEHYIYDNEQRLVEKNTSSSTTGSADEKTVYEFKLGDEKPDIRMFAGQELKKSTIYSSPTDWIETTYFSDSLYIETQYVDNEASMEVVYENKTKIRERKL